VTTLRNGSAVNSRFSPLMAHISSALSRRLLPNLAEGQSRPIGVRSWLANGSFRAETGNEQRVVELKDVSLSELVPYLSYDHERFALASLESRLFSKPERGRPRAISWPLLKTYYAAFFGAHALMRAVGQAVTRVDSALAARLSNIAALYSSSTRVEAGTYHFRVSQQDDRSVSAFLRKCDDTGGAHDQFWRAFYKFLSELSATLSAADEPDAAYTIGEITEIQLILASNGFSSGTWLSSIRNRINYQHELQVWYPYGASPAVIALVGRFDPVKDVRARLDYNASSSPIEAFVCCCREIGAINVALGSLICARNGTTRFKNKWQRLLSS
jgi:hypothetical protein